MASPLIEFVSRATLEERRTALLERSGLELEELRSRAETYALSPEQRDILDAVEDVDYLLDA